MVRPSFRPREQQPDGARVRRRSHVTHGSTHREVVTFLVMASIVECKRLSGFGVPA